MGAYVAAELGALWEGFPAHNTTVALLFDTVLAPRVRLMMGVMGVRKGI